MTLAITSRRWAGRLGRTLFPTESPFPAETVEGQDWEAEQEGYYCWRCGTTCPYEAITESGCSACRRRVVPWDRVIRLGAYRPPLAPWIVGYKFHGQWAWGKWFGRELATAISPAFQSGLVVPVPLHWRRRLWRGYDQAALIARSAADHLNWPMASILRRSEATAPQAAVGSVADRVKDLRGAFTVAHADLSNQDIVLVDDVCTSGATAAACTRVLREAGARRVILAVVAVAGVRQALRKFLSE
jgi:ComF family protein